MKNSLKYMFEMYKQSINTQKFVLVFLLSICFAVYGVVILGFKEDYTFTFLTILNGSWYCAGVLLIMLLNTSNVFSLFEKNKFYIIRCESKKKYLIELIKNICFSNFMLFILNMMLIMIGLNIFNNYHTSIAVKSYEISSQVYLIFTIVKFLVLVIFLSVINVLLYKLIEPKITLIANIICYVLVVYMPVNNTIISSIIQLPLFIGTYLSGFFIQYSSFLFEILCFLLYLVLLFFIIVLLFKIVLKRKRDILV